MSRRVRRRRTFAATLMLALVALVSVLLVKPWQDTGQRTANDDGASSTPAQAADASASRTVTKPLPVAPGLLGQVARLGPRTLATVPAATTKAVVVRGDGPTATTATIELYVLKAGSWHQVETWRGHNGAKGWATDRREGDLRSPVGTFTLSDAGGLLANPGTKLPYYRSKHFVPSGSSVFGDSLEGSFDYVIAIDFNRRRGVSPLDQTQPDGAKRGGGIWLHVDHDGPTHGCVSVPREGMQVLLKTLAPGDHPIVLMGDKARLAT